MKKVVITGGTKLLGYHLSEILIQKGFDVHVTGVSKDTSDSNYIITGSKVHIVDIRDIDLMKKVFEGAEYVFHLAALGNVIQDAINNPIEVESVNVGGTVTALEAAKSTNVKKFIFISSAAVYGEQSTLPFKEDMDVSPIDPYGLYKYFGECLCKLWSSQYKLPTISLRLFNLYGKRNPVGERELVIGRFLDLRIKNQPLTIVGKGDSTRDYVNAKDAARAIWLAAESQLAEGEVVNIGSGVETSLVELASLIGGDIVHVDNLDSSFKGPSKRVADISKAKQFLNWQPEIDLKSGIEEIKQDLNIK